MVVLGKCFLTAHMQDEENKVARFRVNHTSNQKTLVRLRIWVEYAPATAIDMLLIFLSRPQVLPLGSIDRIPCVYLSTCIRIGGNECAWERNGCVNSFKYWTALNTGDWNLTPPLFSLWQCQSLAWTKEEGDANGLCYHSVLKLQLTTTPLTAVAVIARNHIGLRGNCIPQHNYGRI